MTILAVDLIERTRRILLSGHREPMNKLAADVAPGATSLLFDRPLGGIQEGAVLQVGLELFLVWEVNDTARTATVEPAQEGTTAAAHDSGDLVTINPKYPDAEILTALNDDLRSLSSPLNGLYQQKTVDLTWSDTAGGYDLTGVTGLLDVSDVWAQRSGSTSRDWVRLTNYDLERHADTAVFPSGYALYLTDAVESGATVRVAYRAGFGQLTALTDDVVAVTGLPETALDIPPLGAAARLVRPREVARNDTSSEGDPRRAGEVPAGAIRRIGDQLWADRARRIADEAARIGQSNPLMSFIPPKTAYAVSGYGDLNRY